MEDGGRAEGGGFVSEVRNGTEAATKTGLTIQSSNLLGETAVAHTSCPLGGVDGQLNSTEQENLVP